MSTVLFNTITNETKRKIKLHLIIPLLSLSIVSQRIQKHISHDRLNILSFSNHPLAKYGTFIILNSPVLNCRQSIRVYYSTYNTNFCSECRRTRMTKKLMNRIRKQFQPFFSVFTRIYQPLKKDTSRLYSRASIRFFL